MPIVWKNSTCKKARFIYRVERVQKYMTLRKLYELADVFWGDFCFLINLNN